MVNRCTHDIIKPPLPGVSDQKTGDYIADLPPQEREFWAPHQTPKTGVLTSGGWTTEHLTLKASRAWLQELHRNGERETPLFEGTHKACAHQDSQQKQWLHRSQVQTYAMVLEGLLEGWGVAMVDSGFKDADGRAICEYSLEWILLDAYILASTGPCITACSFQGWCASCQTSNKVRTETHLSKDRMLTDFLGPQQPLNMSLGRVMPTRVPVPPTSERELVMRQEIVGVQAKHLQLAPCLQS